MLLHYFSAQPSSHPPFLLLLLQRRRLSPLASSIQFHHTIKSHPNARFIPVPKYRAMCDCMLSSSYSLLQGPFTRILDPPSAGGDARVTAFRSPGRLAIHPAASAAGWVRPVRRQRQDADRRADSRGGRGVGRRMEQRPRRRPRAAARGARWVDNTIGCSPSTLRSAKATFSPHCKILRSPGLSAYKPRRACARRGGYHGYINKLTVERKRMGIIVVPPRKTLRPKTFGKFH